MTAARRLWTLTEPLHALTYFAPEAHAAFAGVGLRGFWRGYFAGRAAPMGKASASLVTATFYGFHPAFVARAVPSIWSMVEPADAITARLDGVDRAARRVLGSEATPAEMQTAADQLHRAIDETPVAGRALFGANLDLDWPSPPHLALWHAATLLREHRGDGHVAALTTRGIDPCAAHVLRIAADALPVDSIQPYRGWDEDDWAAAAARLAERGWLDDGGITPAGADAHRHVEEDTDRLSAELVDRVPDLDVVLDALRPVADRIRAAAVVPYPNPIGVPPPS